MTQRNAAAYDNAIDSNRRPHTAPRTMDTKMRHALSLMRRVVWLVNWANGTQKLTSRVSTRLHPLDYRLVQNPLVR